MRSVTTQIEREANRSVNLQTSQLGRVDNLVHGEVWYPAWLFVEVRVREVVGQQVGALVRL